MELEEVLGYRMNDTSIPHDVEILIKRKNLLAHEATWKSYSLIQNQFSSFHLEDEVTFQAGGIAKPPIQFIYSRRKQHVRHVRP